MQKRRSEITQAHKTPGKCALVQGEQTDIALKTQSLSKSSREGAIARSRKGSVSGIAFSIAALADQAITSRVCPNDSDIASPDQPVHYRCLAIARPHTPALTGKGVAISAGAFRDESTRQVCDRMETGLDAAGLAKLEGQSLLAGMPVETFIVQDARSPLVYLPKPMRDYFGRAMRAG